MEEKLLGRRITTINLDKNERLVSFGAGLLMFVYGLVRLPATAVLMLIGGAYLLFRSVKGYCLIYEALGIDRPWTKENLMQVVEPPVLGDAPPAPVDKPDPVTQASWESFPTSDPPSWTMGRRREDSN